MSNSPLNEQIGGEHYKTLAIQPAEFLHRNRIGYLEGSVIYYTIRHRKKNGEQDIRKAIHSLRLILKIEYGKDE